MNRMAVTCGLVVATMLFTVACGCTKSDSQLAGGALANALSSKTYKIANAADLSEAVSVPTTRVAGSVKGIAISMPDNIKFTEEGDDAGSFRLNFSDNSYFVGTWQVKEEDVELGVGGANALFGVEFPTSDSIALTMVGEPSETPLTGSTPGVSEPIEGGDEVEPPTVDDDQIHPAGSEPSSSGEYDPVWITEKGLAGTWCYASGFSKEEEGAIESIIFNGETGAVYVRPFAGLYQKYPSATSTETVQELHSGENTVVDYQDAMLAIISDATFSLVYDMYNYWKLPTFTITDAGLDAYYAPFKASAFTKISSGEAMCEWELL